MILTRESMAGLPRASLSGKNYIEIFSRNSQNNWISKNYIYDKDIFQKTI